MGKGGSLCLGVDPESVNESETLDFDNLSSTSSLLADRLGNNFLI